MDKFDICVIGSGPAGFSAAMRAVDFGKNVCIVEKKYLGGAGIMNGALTSKTMWELSCDYAIAASVDRGFRAGGLHVDYSKVRKSVIKAAKDKQLAMLSQIESFAKDKGRNGSLTLKMGHAKFIDNTHIEIERDGEREVIEAKYFVIATGSRPRQLPGIDVDQERILDSDGILNIKEFPERMMVIGSGIIGCEFSTIFSNFKQTEVHLLDRSHRVIPFEDDDLSKYVSQNLEKNGVIIHHTANLRTIRKKEDSLEVVLDYQDGHSSVIEVDVCLISIGRIPNTDNIGLENIGIDVNQKKFLDINDVCMIDDAEKCNIFAAGDITGHFQLYSSGEVEGRYAVKAICGVNDEPLDYANMSTLMFFKPEVAAVGMNEKMCRAKKIPYKVATYSNKLVSRAIAMLDTDGFVKILVSDDGENRILGMRAAGPQASAYIVSIAHLINQGNKVKEFLKNIHPHPSISEGILECMRVFEGKSLFKPEAFPHLIKLRRWSPEDDK